MTFSASWPIILILLGVVVAVLVHWTLGLVLIAVGVALVLAGMVGAGPRRRL